MQEVYAHMGSVYYGCCEKLDDRLDVVSRMPNIRKVSCSPWSDREHFAATLPKQYVMSAKPNPAFLAGEQFDEELIRQDLRRTISAAREHGLGLAQMRAVAEKYSSVLELSRTDGEFTFQTALKNVSPG